MSQELTIIQRTFLSHYLNKDSKTYMNGTQSAALTWPKKVNDIAYLAVRGSEMTTAPLVKQLIIKFLDDGGLSNNALDAKMNSLMTAKETKFFSKDGVITDQVEVEALEVQRRTLDMANKLKGRYEAHNKQQQVIIQPPGVDPPDDMGT